MLNPVMLSKEDSDAGSASQEHRCCLVGEAQASLGNQGPGEGRGPDLASTEQIPRFPTSGNSQRR